MTGKTEAMEKAEKMEQAIKTNEEEKTEQAVNAGEEEGTERKTEAGENPEPEQPHLARILTTIPRMAPGIFTAMARIMDELESVGKNRKVSGGGYSYSFRGIDDVYNALHKLMGKHQVFCLPRVLEKETRFGGKGGCQEIVYLRMHYSFCHADGSRVECETMGEGMDASDKACNKAMAMAHKYALLQIFCIPTEDMAEGDKTHEDVNHRDFGNAQTQYQKGNNQSQAQAAPRREIPQEFYDIMWKRHDGNINRIYSELSDFFGRQIQNSEELSDREINDFLKAITFDGD